MLYKLYLVIMQYCIEMKDSGLNLNCNICNQYSRIPQRLNTVVTVFSPPVCHFPSVSLNPFTHASPLNIFLVHQHSIFLAPSVSLLPLPHLLFCYATAVPVYFYSLLCYSCPILFLFPVMLQLSHFLPPVLSSPATVDCWHHVSNLSLHYYICYIDFCVLPFLVSSQGVSQCDSKNLIPEDFCYPECYTAPFQLESKKNEGDDHYMLSAENAQVSYSCNCLQV
jgi:hypothetical protein